LRRRPLLSSKANANAPASAAAAAPTATSTPDVYTEQDDAKSDIAAFQAHQKGAPGLSFAQEARTLVATCRHAVLSTLASSGGASSGAGAGHPCGSVVEFCDDGAGALILSTSTLSSHTGDLAADGRVSMTFSAPGFASLQDARFSLNGFARPIADAEEVAAAREAYLRKFPDAFYVDFGDFRWFRVSVAAGPGGGGGRYVGGFGKVGTVAGADYVAAAADPVVAFSAPVCGHMNGDHAADLLAMVRGNVSGASRAVGPVRMVRVDALGCDLAVAGLFGDGEGGTTRVRLPWPAPGAPDRKALKDRIVELTRAGRAAAAAAGAAAGPGAAAAAGAGEGAA